MLLETNIEFSERAYNVKLCKFMHICFLFILYYISKALKLILYICKAINAEYTVEEMPSVFELFDALVKAVKRCVYAILITRRY